MENTLEAIYMGFGIFLFCMAVSLLMADNRMLNTILDTQKEIIYDNNVADIYGGNV